MERESKSPKLHHIPIPITVILFKVTGIPGISSVHSHEPKARADFHRLYVFANFKETSNWVLPSEFS